jgi:hypothetical protein
MSDSSSPLSASTETLSEKVAKVTTSSTSVAPETGETSTTTTTTTSASVVPEVTSETLIDKLGEGAEFLEKKVETVLSNDGVITDVETSIESAVNKDVIVPLETDPVTEIEALVTNPLVFAEQVALKVFIDATGAYYAAREARNPGDSHIPHPSPALLSSLTELANKQVVVPKSVVAEGMAQHGNGSGTVYTNSGVSPSF